ncbi:hypothetical protein OSB04_021051 [Centaurea solstitialis]|uniref:CCT domain-containing protein n=1 Tax=Centaurea solstitialis TaxID=347529 RepID=A0AA38T169_9ASTR|nr:hypothetical protein OSB04_021051 [Centaurea solstitialis]
MSSCLSSRACGFDLEHMIKWPCSTSGRTSSNSSSPSSTLSESSDSPTRKPRTPRKRPNQTYNEAAALLSMACPNVFTTVHLTNRTTFLPKHHHHGFFNKPPELILPFPVIESSGFLLLRRQRTANKPRPIIVEPNVADSCRISEEFESNSVYDFDTESMLDEEMEQGIDSIMGDSNSIPEFDESNDVIASRFDACYGYPIGLGLVPNSELDSGFLLRNGERALRKGDDQNLSSSPAVQMVSVSPPPAPPKPEKTPVGKKKKKNKKKKVEELMKPESESEFRQGNCNSGDGLMLKLDYEAIMDAWSEKGSPVPEDTPPAADIHAIAAQIDLFSENGGVPESGATRSTDSNHFKKIRYQVKNASSDGRSRYKGRFVTKSNSIALDEET